MPNKSLNGIPWEHLDFVFNSVFEGVMITDCAGIIRLVNTTARQLHMGMDSPNVGFPLADCSPHDWIETRRVLASGQAQLGKRLILANAELLVNRLPIADKGEIVAVVTTMQDIAIFDSIAKSLPVYQALNGEVECILEQFGDAFVALDAEKRILRVNAAYERLASLDKGALLGRFLHQLRRDPAHIIPLVEEVFNKQQRLVSHRELENGDNFLITISPAFNDVGELSMVLVRIQDVSQFLHLQERFVPVEEVTYPIQNDEKNHEIQKICQDTGIIANSAAMMRLVRLVLKVSQADSSVLLQGESGVGKSMLANLIHTHSPRKKNPFIVINAGAIPEEIMESELFGYVKGAFTGALPQGKIGLLEAANKGTLFLDEIGEMKYSLQAKLLEVIEKKSFIRVGCTKRISVDIRIIAATNRNLEQDVDDGLFRKDLYYRLNVIPLLVPPLRERREDIHAMAQGILQHYNTQHNTKKILSKSLIHWLSQHDFSGNMRELINILEWMLVMGEGDELTLADLPVGLQKNEIHDAIPPSSPNSFTPHMDEVQSSVSASVVQSENVIQVSPELHNHVLPETVIPLKQAMRLMEEKYLEYAIAKFGNIQEAADALEVHFSTLWRKLTQYNIEPNKERGGE